MNLAFLATGKPEKALPVIQRFLARRSCTTARSKAYREGIGQGPNSPLTVLMAKPWTDEEIEDWAAYLESAKYEVEEGGNHEKNTK